MISRRAAKWFTYQIVLILFVLSPGLVWAQPKPGDEMIDKYLAQETAKISQRFLDGATTLAEWQARRPRLHQEYLDMLGLWPLPEKTPLQATVTGTLERDTFVVEKLHFQSKPGLYVTGNLYRPKKVEGKLPAVLYVCGHSGRGRDGNKTAFQDHGMWFATNGYVCLIIDTLQLGEVPGIHHGTYSHGRWWWQARGYTPAGVECWNGIRAIDYLVSRPDVDAERIAVTGISGGGASTFWIAAADERVRCAVPVSGMSDLESYVSHKVINGHCDCMFLVNTYAWEWTTIAALVAPRPLLFCNSDQDSIFPMDGNRRIIARLRKLYEMYGKPELVDDYVSHGGHDYRPDLRIAIFKWINKHLKNDTGPVKDADFKPIPGKELRVFLEDKDLPKDAINAKIDETFVPGTHLNLPQVGRFDEWKNVLTKELRAKSFKSLPSKIVTAREIPLKALPKEGEALNRWTTERGIEIDVQLIAQFKDNQVRPVRTILLVNPDEGNTAIPQWAKFCERDSLVVRIAPRGIGMLTWTSKSPPNYVERAHALIGETVDQKRVLDILSVARFMIQGDEEKGKWRVIGRGQAGILGAYAALFEPTISEVVVIDAPKSHRQGPIFLNVLRVLDIPEALGLLAPKKLTLVNAKDKAFDRTMQIYQLAGAEDKLKREYRESPEWKVGLGQVKITPDKPVFLAGYASRNHPFEKVETDLYAKALVLEDQTGQRAVLVTSDLIGFTAALAEPICERIREQTGLSRERIVLSAAHVHTGPVLNLKAEPHGKIGAADAERTAEYTRQLVDKVAALVVDATTHLQPARLSWGNGVVDFVMNRREFTPGGVILGVNPRGLADRTVPVLRIDTPSGKPLAVLFGAAVHNTTLTQDNYELCGDYAGFAQTFIQERLPGVQAMFILGCAGDANPYPRGSMQLAREHGATLGREVCRVLGTKLGPVHGSLQVAFDQVDLPLQRFSRAELEKLAQAKRGVLPEMAKQMLAKLDRGEHLLDYYRCPLTVWQFGRDLTLVGLSGEVVVDYVPLLEKALGPNQLWVAAYCNDVYGYLPSARVLQEGGYETRGLYAGGEGFFSPKAQDVLVESVRALAQKVGRELPTKSGRLESKK